jgi:cold-inducible RNA-binding protein
MKIYVGNLSRDVTEEDLNKAFGEFGQVDSVAIIKDKFSGQSKGFGFVEMPDKTESQAAMEGLNNKDLKGRAMNVNEARPRTDKPEGRRGYGGNRDGFGGGGGRRGPGNDRGGFGDNRGGQSGSRGGPGRNR